MSSIRQFDFFPELHFKTSRSGGAGGQNVNKVSTKVLLEFDIKNSALLSDVQKETLMHKLKTRLTKDYKLQLTVQTERSQLANKEIAIKKFYALLEKCFAPVKKRKPTKPSKAAKEKRLDKKKKTSEIKKQRNQKLL
jgi:ribosome-associated protein